MDQHQPAAPRPVSRQASCDAVARGETVDAAVSRGVCQRSFIQRSVSGGMLVGRDSRAGRRCHARRRAGSRCRNDGAARSATDRRSCRPSGPCSRCRDIRKSSGVPQARAEAAPRDRRGAIAVGLALPGDIRLLHVARRRSRPRRSRAGTSGSGTDRPRRSSIRARVADAAALAAAGHLSSPILVPPYRQAP